MKARTIVRHGLALGGLAALALVSLGLAGCFYIGNVPPVASFTATPQSGPAPLHVVFDASASHDDDGTIVSYLWDFGDTQTGSAVAPTHDYTQTPSRAYNVVLTVTDNAGATDTAAHYVTVTP